MEIKSEEYKEYLSEEYLGIREAAEMLDISETELRDLVARHQVPTHQVAGLFMRLKKKDVEHLKNKWRIERELFPAPEPYFAHQATFSKPTLKERWLDFWYFNDFYVICSVLILFLLYLIVSSQ